MDMPVEEGKRLIDGWVAARDALERAKSTVNRAECDVNNGTNALGKWMCPPDAQEGESFCVWYGDSLIQVTFKKLGDYEIRIRSRGKQATRAGLR